MATWQDIINGASAILQRWARDVDTTSKIVNGPASGPGSTVQTDGGVVNTFAKTLASVSSGTFSGPLQTTDTTQSTSPTTGALRSAGGLGVSKDIYCGGSYHGAIITSAGTIDSIPIGSVVPSTGAFTTLSSTGIASLGASSTVGGVAIVTTTGSQTLTNKTLTAPVIATITNNGTLTLPTSTDTLVGRATADTLTNKTLTSPTINAGALSGTFSGAPTFSGAVVFSGTPNISSGAAFGGTFSGTPTFSGAVSFTSTITPSQTSGIVGTTTNNNANAGSWGEYQEVSPAAVGLTTATSTNITSINLTAGDWDVYGNVFFLTSAGDTATSVIVGLSTTSATLPAVPLYNHSGNISIPAGTGVTRDSTIRRLSLSATTTVFLVANATHSGGTMTGQGILRARRVR